jgi:hypothetical protein
VTENTLPGPRVKAIPSTSAAFIRASFNALWTAIGCPTSSVPAELNDGLRTYHIPLVSLYCLVGVNTAEGLMSVVET